MTCSTRKVYYTDEVVARMRTDTRCLGLLPFIKIEEQNHRAIKRVTKPMLNFTSFHSAASVIAGIELMHMISKGQFVMDHTVMMPLAD